MESAIKTAMKRTFFFRGAILPVVIAVQGLDTTKVAADDFFGRVETRAPETAVIEPRSWTSRTWLQQTVSSGYREPAAGFSRDVAGLNRVETELFSEFDWTGEAWSLRLAGSLVHDWLPDLARNELWSAYAFTDKQVDARRWRFEAADSYLAWQQGGWWIKAGYQTLAWGEAESLKVVDVLARRDQRWPGQEDLEKLRLPVAALSATWNNQLDLVILAPGPTDRRATAYDEFDPLIAARSGDPGADPAVQFQRRERPGYGLRWRERRHGWDTQVIFADVYSYESALDGSAFNLSADPPQVTQLELSPWRQQIAGLGLQLVRGNWLLRSEQAWHRGVRLPRDNPTERWSEEDQWRAMAGADYSGFHNLIISGEVSWSYTRDWARTLASQEWQSGASLRMRYTLFNERLSLDGFALATHGDHGKLFKLSADWEMSDALSVAMSLVEYSARHSEQALYRYRHNDAVLLSVTWGL